MKYLVLLLAMISTATFLISCDSSPNQRPTMTGNAGQIQNSIEVTGQLSVKGTFPDTFLCLTNEEKTDYRLEGPLAEDLERNHQGRYARLKGTLESEEIGPGFPTVINVTEIIEILDRVDDLSE